MNRKTTPNEESAKFRDKAERLVGAAITQIFSYMIDCGLQYGYICSGEAFIFLHIPREDPTTILYYLSTPNDDVGESTEWQPDSDKPNKLHLTAVARVLIFCLQTLSSKPLSQEWRTKVTEELEKWESEQCQQSEESSERSSSEEEISAFMPSPGAGPPIQKSPYFLRSGKGKNRNIKSCRPLDLGGARSNKQTPSSDGGGFGRANRKPNTFSTADPFSNLEISNKQIVRSDRGDTSDRGGKNKRDSHGGSLVIQTKAYCTQRCLRGLLEEGLLDRKCPNAQLHSRSSRHEINAKNFLVLMRQQLATNKDTNCDPLWIQGARGVLFKVTLASHGYTMVAKGTVPKYIPDLQHEAAIYERLRPIQGIYVPVRLGNIDLHSPYFYDAGVRIWHMMFLGWGGTRVTLGKEMSGPATESIRMMHTLGVLHQDAMPRNMLWNEEVGHVMIIDFDRAKTVNVKTEERGALRMTSGNRRVGVGEGEKKWKEIKVRRKDNELFQYEVSQVILEMACA